MALSSTTNRDDYTGNGAVDTYAYTFRIIVNTDLLITVRDTSDVETTLVLTTDYTVTGVGSASGGNVVLVDASQAWLDGDGDLKSSYILTIRRVRPLTQTTDIRNQGSFLPETHEDSFDHFIMILQQHQDELDRSVISPETLPSSTFNPELPAGIATASVALVTNSAGNGWAVGPSTADISGAAASATAAAASATAAAASEVDAEAAAASVIYLWGGTVGGTADVITLTPSPAITVYGTGYRFGFKATGTNTGVVTVNISALGAKSVKAENGTALVAGDIKSGSIYSISYDGTNFLCHEIGNKSDARVVTLADGATIATDVALGDVFDVTLAGNRTLGAPTNPTDGKKVVWRIRQDATGSRTLAYNAIFRFGTDVTSPTLTTTASKTDVIAAIYNSADTKWDVVAVVKGY